MFDFNPGELVPLMLFSIPIIAIMGGITAGIIRQIHRQRSFELMQRERIAAIERGLDPDKIAALARPMYIGDGDHFTDYNLAAAHRRQNLTTIGLVMVFVGIALGIFLYGVTGGHDGSDEKVWTIGLMPIAVGVALLLSAFLSKPIKPGSNG